MSGGMRGGWLSGALVVIVLLALGVLGAPAAAAASAGALDDGFGGGGKVLTDVGPRDSAFGVAVQSDGKLVVVGADSVLLRYSPDGTLDASFGSGGTVTALIQPKDVALQADGKIVVSGNAPRGFAVARYNGDGTPDYSFGVGGKAVTQFPLPPAPPSKDNSSPGLDRRDEQSFAEGVVIQPDGKIVASGEQYIFNARTVLPFDPVTQPITRRLALARYNTDGSPDTTFGAPNGETTTTVDNGECARESTSARVALDPVDGGIMVATKQAVNNSCAFYLARFTTLGNPDPSFGGGSVTTNIRKSSFDNSPSSDSAQDLAIQTDGKIVAAGWSSVRVSAGNSPSDFSVAFALARYTRAGTLDTSFGDGGRLVTSFGPQDALGHAIAIQPADGDIVVGGQTLAGTDPNYVGDFALARYKPDGSLDTGFGTGGKILTDFDPGRRDSAYDIALQGDGKIVAVGESSSRPITGQPPDQGSADFALARYRIDSPPNPGGGGGTGTGTGTSAGAGGPASGNPAGPGGPGPGSVIGSGSSGLIPGIRPGGGVTRRLVFGPVVSRFGLSNNPFVVSRRKTPQFGRAAKVRKHKMGTVFRYTLSEAATVRIVIAQRVLGRRVGKRCVAPTRKLRHARRCARIFVKMTLTRTSHLGENRVAFSGRIGSRKLAPGRYQATITATDAARNASKPQTIAFTIVRR